MPGIDSIRDGSRQLAISSGRLALRSYGLATSAMRPDPEFMIIGAKRGGTTSFYFDLMAHTSICPLFPRPEHLPKATLTKGIHYFDQNYFRGERWFRSHLPSSTVRTRLAHRIGAPVVSGEASPYYLFHPAAASRAAVTIPNVKLILVLRDPSIRTYSHWKERRRNGSEPLDFLDALAAEDDRLAGADEILQTPSGRHYAHENFSYGRQSEYDSALSKWMAHYPREQILVLASEDYYARPQSTLARATEFLGLPTQDLASGTVRNAAAGEELDPSVRNMLARRFAPHITELERMTNQVFAWY